MIFKNSKNKKFLLSVLGVMFFAFGFLLLQTPKAEAAATEKEFIRIKIDSTSGMLNSSQLWNFFATNDGTVDEFNVSNNDYDSTYVCGLLLTEEFDTADDEDYIVWTKKGVILTKSGSLSGNIGAGNYTSCCTTVSSGNAACKMDSGGFCNDTILTNSNYIFQKSYGVLDEDKCGSDGWGTPCNSNADNCCALSESHSAKKYIIKEEAICSNNSKWAFCDSASENECSSDGTKSYACDAGVWTDCTALGQVCNGAGVCGAVVGEICNNGVDDGDPDVLADCSDTADCPDGSPCLGGGTCSGGVCIAAGGITFINPSKIKDLMELVDAIVNFLFYIAIPLAILLIVIAAFLFLTSGGAPQRVTTAKNVLFYAMLGLLIIILAKAISSIVNYVLG
jgi:hypothetical protein